jgi:lipopolysaccharide transport protein LptA
MQTYVRRCRAELARLLALALCSATLPLPAADMGRGGSAVIGHDGCQDPVCLNAASLTADATHLTLHDFNIVYATRGTTVTGDLAEGDSPAGKSKDTHWVLSGHVQISMPQGRLSADRATMQIVNGRISNMTAEGSPAQFDRGGDTTPPGGASVAMAQALQHAHGHARQIVYDLEHGELELNGDSYLTNGCYEFTSEHMSYDIANQRVQADPRDGGGVRGKITRDRGAGACPGMGGGGAVSGGTAGDAAKP